MPTAATAVIALTALYGAIDLRRDASAGRILSDTADYPLVAGVRQPQDARQPEIRR